MIDIWFIFTLFIPFMEVLLHTRMEMIRRQLKNEKSSPNAGFRKSNTWDILDAKEQDKKKKNLEKNLRIFQKLATFGLPIIAIVFLTCFVIVGCFFASETGNV